jgi:hypothetical protein
MSSTSTHRTFLNLHWLLITPWCRILCEKLVVTQIVKKYPAFLWNPKVHHRVHKSPPLNPILSQPNPVRPIDPYLPKVHVLSLHWILYIFNDPP